MVNPNHITPYSEIPEAERELADDLVFDRRRGRTGALYSPFRVPRRATRDSGAGSAANPTRGWSPRRRCHFHILAP